MSLTRTERIAEVIKDIRNFRFSGPIDDFDAQSAFCLECRHLLIQLQRLTSPILPSIEKERLNSLEVDVNDVFSAFEVHSEMLAFLPDIETAMSGTDSSAPSVSTTQFIIHTSVIDQLNDVRSTDFDTTVLVRLCKEINSCFSHDNIVATALTMRAVLNYVPPVFGQETFEQVLAQCERSLKENFTHLQEGLRRIADYHTHRTMTKSDSYPSENQVEPFKPQFEFLLHQILSRLS